MNKQNDFPTYLTAKVLIDDILKTAMRPEFFVSNFNFSLYPFFISFGNTYKRYAIANISFIYIGENKEKHNQEKIYNSFVNSVNCVIHDTVKTERSNIIQIESFILHNKIYRANVGTAIVDPSHVIRITSTKNTIIEKYTNKIEVFAQCAGDKGFTVSELIPKTQLLTKDERQQLLDFMVDSMEIKCETIQTKTKSIKRYYWINHEYK